MVAYPRIWVSTGCGSYREVRAGVFEIDYRPDGAGGPHRRIRRQWEEPEILAFLARAAANKGRRREGLVEVAGWDAAIEAHMARLEARECKAPYRREVLLALQSLRDHVGVAVNLVRPGDVESWMQAEAARLKADNRPGWARTCNKYREQVGPFFRRLYNKGELALNPVPGADKFEQPRHLKRRLTPQEYWAVWQVCEPSLRDLMTWGLFTAARFGEIRNAKRDDVKGGVWYIRDRKARDDHALPLSPLLMEIVLRQPACPDGFLFHRWVPARPGGRPEGDHRFKAGAPLENGWAIKTFKERCAWAKVDRFRPHDLRRAAAQWARAAGGNMAAIQALLGHTAMSTTEIYTGHDTAGVVKVLYELIANTLEKGKQSQGV